MTLSFSTHINDNPTHFVEKIWAGLISEIDSLSVEHYSNYHISHLNQFGTEMSDYEGIFIDAKLHTIREDKSNRWTAGNDIHMVINNRTPKRFQFAPVVKVVSTQKIQVCHYSELMYGETKPIVQIDDVRMNDKEVETLALNDGFASVDDFFSWFNKDFTGKIIHWTNLKY